MRITRFIEDVELPGELLRDYNTMPGSSDGFDFCYRSAVFDNSKELQYDNHTEDFWGCKRYTPWALRYAIYHFALHLEASALRQERWPSEQLKGEGTEISIFKKEVKELGNVPKIDFHDS